MCRNGLTRTSWNTFKDCNGILDELHADIICFQEMKSSRASLAHSVAVPENFASFFSFPATKGGYSGVAVYVDLRRITPLKAEEGLSGTLQPKPPLEFEERVSPSYPSTNDIELFPDEDGGVPHSFDALDAEGRGLVVDFGLFVLINVYCPNETSDARAAFKMNYHLLLQERVRRLIEEEHREVIVLGDINVCATPMDHCDGHLPSTSANFWEHPARQWFRNWLGPNGPMIDVVRSFWPERKGMFTCWNTKISARATNYGTRIDYVLVTRGLMKWIKHGDIQPSLKGSDHCPIFVDLHDEITLETGETVKLLDCIQQGTKRDLPRIAAKHWEEFSGKQTLLSSFFGKGKNSEKSPSEPEPPGLVPSESRETSVVSSQAHGPAKPSTSTSSISIPKSQTKSSKLVSKPITSTKKRKPSPTPSGSKKKVKGGQADISSFFTKTSNSSASQSTQQNDVIHIPSDTDEDANPIASQDQLDADYRLALQLSEEASTLSVEPSSSQNSSSSKSAWSSLFTPIPPPKCNVHGEITKKYIANKPGPNKGRAFYLCSRPVGPGYDKGKGERLREEVDHQYRCNYFKWASEVKREASSSK
ncbi:hypothetical protein QCA50_008888 [Cerrena zonata]|uniref:DNA-(apurinic or apyrimidinic site) endonuclease n=1 Tax=Cerrena zonata TaxID=2478898 RepID=A0AAW0G2V5_9APHY